MDDAAFKDRIEALVERLTQAAFDLADENRELKKAIKDLLDCNPAYLGSTLPAVERASQLIARIEAKG